MNALYKRLVALGMISVAAFLGFLYCIVEFKEKPIYIAVVSLMLVASAYLFFMALIQVRAAKEAELRDYIRETVLSSVEKLGTDTDDDTMERLAKATYVQIRKLNTGFAELIASDHQNTESRNLATREINESIEKAVKIIVKYNQTGNRELIDSLQSLGGSLSGSIDKISDSIEHTPSPVVNVPAPVVNVSVPAGAAPAVTEVSDAVPEVPKVSEVSEVPEVSDVPKVPEVAEVTEAIDEVSEVSEVSEAVDEVSEAPEVTEAVEVSEAIDETPEEAPAASVAADFFAQFGEPEAAAEPVPAEEPEAAAEPAVSDDPNKQLSADEIAALFAAAAPAPTEEPAAEPEAVTEPEPVAETKSATAPAVSDDPNRQLSGDEIAALFAQAAGAAAAEPEAAAAPAPAAEPAADIIQFPTKAAEPEETAAPAVSDDPNKQLSADEIAALFAAAAPAPAEQPAEEPAKEGTPEGSSDDSQPEAAMPVSDDPNKQLSADEIAALFASMGSGS